MPRRAKPAADPTRAVAYLRCSTDRQDLSLDAQHEAIGGGGVGRLHGVSGGTRSRTGPG